jgi:hypothetical protein
MLPQMTDEPGTIDGEIIEEMKNLELMISFHKKALAKDLEPAVFRPSQIRGLLDYNFAKGLWDSEDYDGIRRSYASAWIVYYTTAFSDDVFYTEEQFANFFKID